MSQICIIFEKPEKLEHYDAFLLAKRGLNHVEFDNGDSAYQGLGYVEIDPQESDPLPLCQSLVKVLQDVGAQYCAMVAATDQDGVLVGPATFDVYFDGKHEVLASNDEKPDFDVDCLTAAGMDRSRAETVLGRFFPAPADNLDASAGFTP